MRELKHFKSVDFAVATKTPGNREGKGANGFLTDWHSSAPRGVVAKPRRQLLAELFTSMRHSDFVRSSAKQIIFTGSMASGP